MSDLQLYRRGKIWHVRGTVKVPGQKIGIRVRESTGHARLREAEAYRDSLREAIIERSLYGAAATATFSTAVMIYLEKGGEKRFLKPIHDRFGHERLKDITADKVSAFALERYGHLTPQSVKRQLYTPLNAVLNRASKALGIAPITFEAPKTQREAVEYAPPEWFPKFFTAAHFRIAAMVLFLTTTGSRVTEACNLTVRDCDLDSLKVLLRKTKNGKPRMVPIDATVARVIAAMIEQDGAGEEDRVFGYSSRWSVNQAIERVCAKAGITYYSSHKLGRHAFAARLLNSGRTLKEVQDAGGWSSISIVSEVYGHLEENAVDDLVRGQGSAVGQLLTDTPLTHTHHTQKRKSTKTPDNSEGLMVGTRGIEPLTPTMSRMTSEVVSSPKPTGVQAFLPKNYERTDGEP